jgi:dCMP deaminase
MECSKLIIQAGIRRVVYLDEYHSDDGIELLRRVGIETLRIELPE